MKVGLFKSWFFESCLPEEQAAAGSSQPVCFPQSASKIQSCVQKSNSCLHTKSSFKSSLSWSWNGEIVAPIRRQVLFILATLLGLNHLSRPSIWMIYAWSNFATLTLLNLLGTLHGIMELFSGDFSMGKAAADGFFKIFGSGDALTTDAGFFKIFCPSLIRVCRIWAYSQLETGSFLDSGNHAPSWVCTWLPVASRDLKQVFHKIRHTGSSSFRVKTK